MSFALRQPADPALYPPQADAITIRVVDHGYHAGLILPRQTLADMAAAERLPRLSAALAVFSAFDHVEIGWGEENFYRSVPTASLAAIPHVLRAMLNPVNSSVLHIVGFNGEARRAFPVSDLITLDLSLTGLRRMARAMDAQLRVPSSGEVVPLGPGLYGPSAFFAAQDRYHLFNTCNHWIGQMLALAGVPYAPVESVISAGLMANLRRRALQNP
jgi:uncharacterized protein (TIGR02117 family)